MTRTPLLAVVVLAAALTGCTADPAPAPAPTTVAASPPAWTEPADYGFVLERRCDGGEDLGRYRVTVRDGAVTGAERIDGRTAAGEEEIDVPSLGQLMELTRTAIDDGAQATTVHDPADGHPTEVVIDRGDGPECFRISEYAVSR